MCPGVRRVRRGQTRSARQPAAASDQILGVGCYGHPGPAAFLVVLHGFRIIGRDEQVAAPATLGAQAGLDFIHQAPPNTLGPMSSVHGQMIDEAPSPIESANDRSYELVTYFGHKEEIGVSLQ